MTDSLSLIQIILGTIIFLLLIISLIWTLMYYIVKIPTLKKQNNDNEKMSKQIATALAVAIALTHYNYQNGTINSITSASSKSTWQTVLRSNMINKNRGFRK